MDKPDFDHCHHVYRPELAHAADVIDIADSDEHFCGLIYLCAQWGVDRNITRQGGATAFSQMKKLQEELTELRDALIVENDKKVVDGIGDMLVVLIQVCRLSGITLTEALEAAWNDIKDRKGKMVDGVFVKEVE